MTCVESLRTQAYFDGQVDALQAIELGRHVEHCGECSALIEDLARTRAALRAIPQEAASAELLARLRHALEREEPIRPPSQPSGPGLRHRTLWLGALGGAAGCALAASLALFVFFPWIANPLPEELLAAHVRSLMPAHLIDVESSDHHTVKPWFAGHADVSPLVADFTPQGYRLIGGRTDYVDHQRVAVVVYRHGAHVINVFGWSSTRRPLTENTTRNGYHMAFFRAGDLQYCAVSDAGRDELDGLVRLFRDVESRR